MVVFPDSSIALVADEVVTIGQLAGQPGVAMRMRLVYLELDLVVDFSLPIDLDNTSGSGFGDHDVAIGQRLEGMDLDTFSLVAVFLGGIVGPDDLLGAGVDFDDLAIAFLHHDVPAGKNMDIVDAPPLHLPFDLALLVDQGELIVSLYHDAVFGLGRREQAWQQEAKDGDAKQ